MSNLEERLAAVRLETLELAKRFADHVDQRVEESKALLRRREREAAEKRARADGGMSAVE